MLSRKMQPPGQGRIRGIAVIDDDQLLVSYSRLLGLGHARAGVNEIVIYREIVGGPAHVGQEEPERLRTFGIGDICKAYAGLGI